MTDTNDTTTEWTPGDTYQGRLMLALWRAHMERLPNKLYRKFAAKLNITPDEIDDFYIRQVKPWRTNLYNGCCCAGCLIDELTDVRAEHGTGLNGDVGEQLRIQVCGLFVEALNHCPTWCETEVREWWTYLGMPGDAPHKVAIQVDYRMPGDGSMPESGRYSTYYVYHTAVDDREQLAKRIMKWLPPGVTLKGFKVRD